MKRTSIHYTHRVSPHSSAHIRSILRSPTRPQSSVPMTTMTITSAWYLGQDYTELDQLFLLSRHHTLPLLPRMEGLDIPTHPDPKSDTHYRYTNSDKSGRKKKEHEVVVIGIQRGVSFRPSLSLALVLRDMSRSLDYDDGILYEVLERRGYR
jgi:hypothetical protein